MLSYTCLQVQLLGIEINALLLFYYYYYIIYLLLLFFNPGRIIPEISKITKQNVKLLKKGTGTHSRNQA